MINHGKQCSYVQPKNVEILETKVFEYNNIEKIKKVVYGEGVELYEFDLIEYEKNEYILILKDKIETEKSTNMELKERVDILSNAIDFITLNSLE